MRLIKPMAKVALPSISDSGSPDGARANLLIMSVKDFSGGCAADDDGDKPSTTARMAEAMAKLVTETIFFITDRLKQGPGPVNGWKIQPYKLHCA